MVTRETLTRASVAPLAGAWIEMFPRALLWESALVAPLAGAWIEIVIVSQIRLTAQRRSPRGSVD